MNSLEVYETFLGMYKHFTNKGFDFHNTNLRIKRIPSNKKTFEYIARNFSDIDTQFMFLGKLLIDFEPRFWIGDYINENSINNGNILRGWVEGINYWFEHDIKSLMKYAKGKGLSFIDLFKIDNDYPIIIKLLNENKIFLPTLFLINKITNISNYYNRALGDDDCNIYNFKLCKLDGFFDYNVQTLENTLTNNTK